MPVADEKAFPALVSSSPRAYDYRRWRTPSPPLRAGTPSGLRADPELRSADDPPSRACSPTPSFHENHPGELDVPTQEEEEYEHIDLEDYVFPTTSSRPDSPAGTLVEPPESAGLRRMSASAARKPRLSLSGLAARFSDKENRRHSRSRSREELYDEGEMKRSSSDSADRPRIPLAAPKPMQASGFLRHLSFSRPSSPLFPGTGDSSIARERRGSMASIRASTSAM